MGRVNSTSRPSAPATVHARTRQGGSRDAASRYGKPVRHAVRVPEASGVLLVRRSRKPRCWIARAMSSTRMPSGPASASTCHAAALTVPTPSRAGKRSFKPPACHAGDVVCTVLHQRRAQRSGFSRPTCRVQHHILALVPHLEPLLFLWLGATPATPSVDTCTRHAAATHPAALLRTCPARPRSPPGAQPRATSSGLGERARRPRQTPCSGMCVVGCVFARVSTPSRACSVPGPRLLQRLPRRQET